MDQESNRRDELDSIHIFQDHIILIYYDDDDPLSHGNDTQLYTLSKYTIAL
jgi:hypothetical protein